MKHFNRLALCVAISFAAGAHAAGTDATLRFQKSEFDLVPATLITTKSAALAGTHRETAPVRMSWALPADSKISAQQPFVRDSREYWTTITADSLAKGAVIRTTSPGAVVRLSPIGSAKVALLDPFAIEITSKGQRFERGKAFANAANVAELNASGAAFPAGTVAFKLKPEVGSGAISITMPKAQQDYLVHVFEPDSNEVLSLTTDHLIAMHGAKLRVIARMNSGDAVDAIEGSITSPGGHQVALAFKRQPDGSYVAETRHNGLEGVAAGLWEIHAFASSKSGDVQRDAKTAIASAAPRARLADIGSSTRERNGALHVKLGTEVAASGRYEVRGTLYGVDIKSGSVRPAAMAHAAAVLGAGMQSLELVYDAATMKSAGVRAPFEVREITLIDQGAQSVIELRNAGLQLK